MVINYNRSQNNSIQDIIVTEDSEKKYKIKIPVSGHIPDSGYSFFIFKYKYLNIQHRINVYIYILYVKNLDIYV